MVPAYYDSGLGILGYVRKDVIIGRGLAQGLPIESDQESAPPAGLPLLFQLIAQQLYLITKPHRGWLLCGWRGKPDRPAPGRVQHGLGAIGQGKPGLDL